MAYTNSQKAKDLAIGASQGAAINAVVGTAATLGLRSLTRAAPAAAKAVSVGLSWPVVAGAMAIGATIGGVKAANEGRSVVGGMIAGSLFIFPKNANAEEASRHKAPVRSEDDDKPTIEGRLKELADRPGAGGDPEVYRRMAENDREAMRKAKTIAKKNYHEKRALMSEKTYEEITGQHIGPTAAIGEPAKKPNPAEIKIPNAAVATQPAKPYAEKGFAERMMDAAIEAIAGKGQTKKDNKFDDQRAELHEAIRAEQEKSKKEFANNPKKGENQKAFDKRIDELRGKLKEVDAAEEKATAGDRALMRSAGAVIGGALIGGWLGSKTVKAAEATTAAAAKSLETVSRNAAKMAGASKNSVIAGTIQGDHATAAIRAAKTVATTAPVSAVQAFGVPTLNAVHGSALIGWSMKNPDDPMSVAARTEGMAAVTASLVGAKFGMQARALRPFISPANQAKINAADARLSREVRKGPAGVAKAKAAQATGVAQNNAARRVAETGAQVGITRAQGSAAVSTAQVRGAARVEAAKIGAKLPTINAGARVGVAKARGAGQVGVAEARGKQAVTRQVKRGQDSVYKDTWQDTRGRVFHRKDMSVRNPSARRAAAEASRGAANDNSGALRKAR